MTFILSGAQVRVFLKRFTFEEWVSLVQSTENWISADFNPTLYLPTFSEVYYLQQTGVQGIGAGVEPVTFPGLPQPALVGEFEATLGEWGMTLVLHKSNLVDNLIYSFQPADYPPYVWEALMVFPLTGGGVHLQNCLPRSMNIQFSEATNLPTINITFLTNFILFLPPGTFVDIPQPDPPQAIIPKIYSSILDMNDVNYWGLKVSSLNLTVTNNIQGHYTINRVQTTSPARRALKMFSMGYQTGELSMRVVFPPETKQSLQQADTPIRSVQLTLLDDEFVNQLGVFNFTGRFSALRWDVNPTAGVLFELNTSLGGSVFWQYQG